MADIDYYNDESQWGNYQYVTLQQIINDFKMLVDDDDIAHNLPRHKILYHAQRGLRELYYDVLREIKAIQFEIGTTLSVTLPRDFVNYVRLSWVDSNGQLFPMAVDNTQNIATAYLQDHNSELLFDNDGCILKADGSKPMSFEPTPQSTETNQLLNFIFNNGTVDSFNPNANLANHYQNGKYRIDKDRGVIEFGSNVYSRIVVLEYISDGLYTSSCEGTTETDIKVHKFAEQALQDFIYYSIIKMKRNVPANEKARARKEYFNSRRITKRRINAIRTPEIIQAFRQDTMWIKDPNVSNNFNIDGLTNR